MSETHDRVRMVIDIGRQMVIIGNQETQLTEQQVQVLAKLAQKGEEFTSKRELQLFLGAKSPAGAQVVISRLKKRVGGRVLTVLVGSGYRIDRAYIPQVIGGVKEMQALADMSTDESPKYRGDSLRLTHREDELIQRWANACNKVNDCGKCIDEVICQRLADKLVGRVLSYCRTINKKEGSEHADL